MMINNNSIFPCMTHHTAQNRTAYDWTRKKKEFQK